MKMTVPNPVLSLSTKSVDFGAVVLTETVAMRSFTIGNAGGGTLSWSAKLDAVDMPEWLVVSPVSGTASSGEATTVTLSLNMTNVRSLNPGTYTRTLSVTSNGGDGSVQVRIVVPEPSLSAYPVSLDFGTEETEDSFDVINTGGGTLTWEVTSRLPRWLDVYPQSGSVSAAGSSTVSVTVSRSDLDPGDYSSTIVIGSEYGNASVSVTMSVPEPELTVNPRELNFGTVNTLLSFTITNTGGGTLSWQVTTDPEFKWVSISLDKEIFKQALIGIDGAGESSTIWVRVSRANMRFGTYKSTLRITSNGGNAVVSIVMTVEVEPQ